MGPYQPKLRDYPLTNDGMQEHRFQYHWFKKFPWLEYSEVKDSAFCFPCFLFDEIPSNNPKFVIEGFSSWKRHEGGPSSHHNKNMQSWGCLRNPIQHIDRLINAQTSQQLLENRLRLKTSIIAVKWLAKQACAFRGHDESVNSRNRGNFIELIKHSAECSKEIAQVVLENAPSYTKYTSSDIQKELLNILANKVRNKIRRELGDGKFCILVDEALDESDKEQMAIILRYVDCDGYIRECFFEVVNVMETTAVTLKKEICNVLARYDLLVENIRGQGYDGASNMRGAWNGLQALFLKDCPYAYYIHCFAHQLQLALVAASNDVPDVWLFFSALGSIVNVLTSSAKRLSELKSVWEAEIIDLIASGEVQTGTGANQIHTLQRPGATRWSSHFRSVSRLLDLFSVVHKVLGKLVECGPNNNIRGEAKGACESMISFKFVFILHLLNKVLGMSDLLCQALQVKSQDILNVVHLVSTTKKLLQRLRDNGWETFIENVVLFCEKNEIDMPDMKAHHMKGRGRSCQQNDYITVEHYYHYDIFNTVIDFQLMELNNRFTEQTLELLTLSSALNPIDAFKSFKIEDICSLAERFYPEDFTKIELQALRRQLECFEIDIHSLQEFQNITSLSELCRRLVETRKSQIYFLLDRLIRLVLTLPVSTATTERAFSAMKLIKTTHRNKMENEFLSDCMVIYIEREIADNIDSDAIVDEFSFLKNRRTQLRQ
ncbi:TTF-type domain-containing protein [Citrus sinensis]|uniref:TTF-type domain-containing protein n=1 Tax=Citrus sinensis TaxID=2711 RepID=A0ACB8NTE4_CITSI|nr:TTF-type domain-containing protein [Citrus sinensis]